MNTINQARRCAMMLLQDGFSEQRDELMQAGVASHRVLTLYPLDFNTLHPTLNTYVDAGKRMSFFNGKFAKEIAYRDQQRFEKLDLDQRAASHRELGPLMENAEAKALRERVVSTFDEIDTKMKASAKARVEEDYPHLYTAIWYALNVVGEDQEEAAKLLLDLTAELLPDLKVA